MSQPLQVVAAIICHREKVLITERPAGKSWAGFWEFPGGKIEAGESATEALLRELREELGIDLKGENFSLFYSGRRGDEVVIDFYRCDLQENISPQGLEGQRWQWLEIARLNELTFPPPNTVVLEKLMQLV